MAFVPAAVAAIGTVLAGVGTAATAGVLTGTAATLAGAATVAGAGATAASIFKGSPTPPVPAASPPSQTSVPSASPAQIQPIATAQNKSLAALTPGLALSGTSQYNGAAPVQGQKTLLGQ